MSDWDILRSFAEARTDDEECLPGGTVTYGAIRKAVQRIAELEQALRTLVDKYIANRGTEHEFVSCITPKGIPDYWRKAIDAVIQDHPDK